MRFELVQSLAPGRADVILGGTIDECRRAGYSRAHSYMVDQPDSILVTDSDSWTIMLTDGREIKYWIQ